MTGFEGKTVLITGSTSGIGRDTAIRLAQLGANVVISGAGSSGTGPDIAKHICDAGGRAVYIRCDVTNEASVKHLIEQAIFIFGKLDMAFNNAGIGPDGVRIPFAELTECDTADFDSILSVNIKGVFLCMKHELAHMRAAGGGTIVNTSSIGGLRMTPRFGAYGPSKAAVNALTQLAALENASYSIRVNAVCPGPTAGTGLSSNADSQRSEQQADERTKALIPLGRKGSTQDVAEAVVWLLSDSSRHTTGQLLSVDGGMHCK